MGHPHLLSPGRIGTLSLRQKVDLAATSLLRDAFANEPISQPNGPTHRVGPALLYTIFDRPDLRFNKPTLILLMQWWAKSRYRTGQDVSAGIPYFVLGFRFEGDLLPDPKRWNAKSQPLRKRKRSQAAAQASAPN